LKIIAQNKKAFFDYQVLDQIEAGIVLTGDEVKSIRAGHVNLTGAFATIHDGQLNIINLHVSPYSHAYQKKEDTTHRTRRLLIHKRELVRLASDVARKGITLVPLKIYFNEKGLVKIDLGLCKHKKAHERKEDIKERDIARQTRRELKGAE
jgi:SsrA-binding protein